MMGCLTKMSNSVVSNNWGGVDSVSHDRGVVSGGGMVGGGGVISGAMGNRVSHNSLGVLSLAIIGHISNIAIIGGGVVVDMLDPAVRESNRVRALSIAGTVRRLGSLEV